MFWIKHPRPLLSTRAVAEQVVARKAQALPDTRLIIVDRPAHGTEPAPPPHQRKDDVTP